MYAYIAEVLEMSIGDTGCPFDKWQKTKGVKWKFKYSFKIKFKVFLFVLGRKSCADSLKQNEYDTDLLINDSVYWHVLTAPFIMGGTLPISYTSVFLIPVSFSRVLSLIFSSFLSFSFCFFSFLMLWELQ